MLKRIAAISVILCCLCCARTSRQASEETAILTVPGSGACEQLLAELDQGRDIIRNMDLAADARSR